MIIEIIYKDFSIIILKYLDELFIYPLYGNLINENNCNSIIDIRSIESYSYEHL